MPKIQGEGDYESARRYNQHTKEHVEGMDPAELEPTEDTPAEQSAQAEARREAKSHAKAGEQDARDAEIFRRGEQSSDR